MRTLALSLFLTALALACGGGDENKTNPYAGSWLMDFNCYGAFWNRPISVSDKGAFGGSSGATVITGTITDAGAVSGTVTNVNTMCYVSDVGLSGSCTNTNFCSGSLVPSTAGGAANFTLHR
jgi:hypothetical protein